MELIFQMLPMRRYLLQYGRNVVDKIWDASSTPEVVTEYKVNLYMWEKTKSIYFK